MPEFAVKIVQFEPLRVASFLGFGPNPEELAWQKLTAWAEPRGLLQDLEKHPLFGFNNPDPSPGSPNYGYEVWIEIDADMQVEEDINNFIFNGGLYAVTRCEVPKGGFEVIPDTWKKLVAWHEESKYKHGKHQWLEQHITISQPEGDFILDLYLPILE